MAEIKIEKNGNTTTLRISGELAIEHAEEFKNALQRSIESSNHVILDLENITCIDLSGLQLLCSAHRTSLNLKKTMELKANYPEVLKQAVEETGYVSKLPVCSPGNPAICFWMEISKEILCQA